VVREGWEDVPLGDATLKIGSGATPRGGKSVYVDAGTAFIRSQNVYDNRFSREGLAHINDDASRALRGVTVEPGDVLIDITGESVTRTCIVPTECLPARVSQHVAIIRPDQKKLDPRFLTATLLSPSVKAYLNLLSSAGATRRALTKRHLQELVIALPPLEEQQRIAGVLRTLDDLIESLEATCLQVDAMQSAWFKSLWDGTTRIAVEDMGTLTMGQSPPGSTYNEQGEGLPFYQGVRDFGKRHPGRRVYCTAPTRVAQSGDILIAVRAPIGDTNVAIERMSIGRGLAALHPHKPASALQALRCDPNLWSRFEGEGTVFAAVNRASLAANLVAWVDDSELEEGLAAMDQLYLHCWREAAGIRQHRDELLPLLLSGAIRVDEVAA